MTAPVLERVECGGCAPPVYAAPRRRPVSPLHLICEAFLIFAFFAGLGFCLVIVGALLHPMPGV